MRIVYAKESTHTGNDCMIHKSAFVVDVEEGYVATHSTIYRGYMGFDTRCQSFVFDNLSEAVEFCDEYFEKREEE